jgi:3-deoxy-D-manno-octulosonic-acid transferase
LPFLPSYLLWRSRKNSSYRKKILERFAYFNFLPLSECIWIHAVSIGESGAAIPLVKTLINQYPDITIVMTTMTPTGAEIVKNILGNKILQLYVPYDYPWVVKRFLRYTNPRLLILIETEIWPNILYYTNKNQIPSILCNARISARSFASYMKIRFFIKPFLNYITIVMAQSKVDADRLLSLGLEDKKLSISGNMKFDLVISNEVSEQAKKLRTILGQKRSIWIAASTHKGEETKILIVAKKILNTLQDTLLILVPRHPERFNEVYEICCREKFKITSYSKLQNYTTTTNIILGDTMGQLLLFYAVSDIAFVGGSLVPCGGHNLLEPAALSKPIISGKYLNNFLEISSILSNANALIKVDNELELSHNLLKLFQNSTLRKKLGKAAFMTIINHCGATQKILDAVKNMLSTQQISK